MSDIPTIARKLNSTGIEWEQAQVHAEVITTAVDNALEKVATKGFVISQIAELRAEMQTGFAELRAEMQTGLAESRTENKASQLRQLRWIIGTIVAIGSLQIAAQIFA